MTDWKYDPTVERIDRSAGTKLDPGTYPHWGDACRDKQYLYELYWARLHTMGEMARVLGVTTTTVRKALHHHGIPTRDSPTATSFQDDDYRVRAIQASDPYHGGSRENYADPRPIPPCEVDRQAALAWLFEGDGSDPHRAYGQWPPWVDSKAWYYELYWRRWLSMAAIADHHTAPHWLSRDGVRERMDELGVPRYNGGSGGHRPESDDGSIPPAFRWPDNRNHEAVPDDVNEADDPDTSPWARDVAGKSATD